MSTGGAEIAGEVRTILGVDDKDAADKFQKLQDLMDRAAKSALDLDRQIRAGKYAPGPELDAAKAKLDHLLDVQNQLKDVQDRLASSTATVSTAMAGVQNGSSRWASSLLQVGYAADDLQYGQRRGRAA